MAVGAEGNVYQGAIARGAWVDAEHLQAGFLLLNDDESWSTVERVEVLPVELKAFNLSVADNHTYFVAANDEAPAVWVHNTCKVWNEDTLKILDDLLADPKIADRIAKNPKLLDGWKRVTEDFADSGISDFGRYWDEALDSGRVSWDDMHDFASANLWKNPSADPAKPWTATLWPPKDGFAVVNEVVQRNVTTVSGGQGKYLDRYIAKERNGLPLLPENDTGRYLADDGATYTSRALAPGTLDSSQLIRYEVMDDIRFEAGPIAPWFDEVGGATQYFVIGPQGRVRTVKDLINDGALRVIYPKPSVVQLSSGKSFINDIDQLPEGYKFITNANGDKSIARIDVNNPDTPPLKVEADGRVVAGDAGRRTIDELAPGGNVPGVAGNEFNQWFDNLTPQELDDLWQIGSIKKKIGDRIRHPGGLHEWCMVCKMPEIKRWGISVDEVKRFRSRTTDLTWTNPETGLPGVHGGHGSNTFHRELKAIIENSENIAEFNDGMLALVERWQVPVEVIPDLILE